MSIQNINLNQGILHNVLYELVSGRVEPVFKLMYREVVKLWEQVVMVGKEGVCPSLLKAVDAALEAHELIKVRFVEFKDERKPLTGQVAADAGAVVVGVSGVRHHHRLHFGLAILCDGTAATIGTDQDDPSASSVTITPHFACYPAIHGGAPRIARSRPPWPRSNASASVASRSRRVITMARLTRPSAQSSARPAASREPRNDGHVARRIRTARSRNLAFVALKSTIRVPQVFPRCTNTVVVTMFRTIFVAVPAFIRVEPVTTSGPGASATQMSSDAVLNM